MKKIAGKGKQKGEIRYWNIWNIILEYFQRAFIHIYIYMRAFIHIYEIRGLLFERFEIMNASL